MNNDNIEFLLKEEYRKFNLTEEYNQESITKFEDYIERFKKSKYREFIEFGIMLSRWKYYIVNSFIRVNGKRMSNGPISDFYWKKRNEGKHHRVTLSHVARRLINTIFFLEKHNQDFDSKLVK